MLDSSSIFKTYSLFLPSPPFLPLYFPILYFQVYVAVGAHVIPTAPKPPLDTQGLSYPNRNCWCVLLPPPTPTQYKPVPPEKSKGWATGTVTGDCPGLWYHLSSEARPGQPMGPWRPDSLRKAGEMSKWWEDICTKQRCTGDSELSLTGSWK